MSAFVIWLKKLFGVALTPEELLYDHKGPVIAIVPKASAPAPTVPPSTNPPAQSPFAPSTPVTTPASRLKCFDVSHYEPNINWPQAVAFGEKVCMSKCTDGASSVDSTFAADRAACAKFKLPYMPYHFFRFDPDAPSQAIHMMNTVGKVATGELAPCLDLEWDNVSGNMQYRDSDHGAKGSQGCLDDAGAQKALAFLHALENLCGMTPFIYTSAGFFPGKCSPSVVAQFARYPLWIASYRNDAPKIPAPWKTWTFWQYSSTTPVPGIGKIDVSWFNGDEAALQKLVKQ